MHGDVQENLYLIQIKREKTCRKPLLEKTRDAIRRKLLGRRLSPSTEFKKGNPGPWLGKKRSRETIEKMRRAILGRHASEETKKKLREVARCGSENKNWKESGYGYGAIHSWVRRWKGKPVDCKLCGCNQIPPGRKRWFEWANISGKYKRDLNDFFSLCLPCHKKRDKRINSDSRSLFITAFGETKRAVEWSEDPRCVVSLSCLTRRINLYGYVSEKALTKSSMRFNKPKL